LITGKSQRENGLRARKKKPLQINFSDLKNFFSLVLFRDIPIIREYFQDFEP